MSTDPAGSELVPRGLGTRVSPGGGAVPAPWCGGWAEAGERGLLGAGPGTELPGGGTEEGPAGRGGEAGLEEPPLGLRQRGRWEGQVCGLPSH